MKNPENESSQDQGFNAPDQTAPDRSTITPEQLVAMARDCFAQIGISRHRVSIETEDPLKVTARVERNKYSSVEIASVCDSLSGLVRDSANSEVGFTFDGPKDSTNLLLSATIGEYDSVPSYSDPTEMAMALFLNDGGMIGHSHPLVESEDRKVYQDVFSQQDIYGFIYDTGQQTNYIYTPNRVIILKKTKDGRVVRDGLFSLVRQLKQKDGPSAQIHTLMTQIMPHDYADLSEEQKGFLKQLGIIYQYRDRSKYSGRDIYETKDL